jgi:hypothetical protein
MIKERKIRVLMVQGQAFEEFETAAVQDSDDGTSVVYYVGQDGEPNLEDPVLAETVHAV